MEAQILTPKTEVAAYTIDEFCVAYRMSRSLFYKMVREGRGPRMMRIGARRYITVVEANAWAEAQTAAGGNAS